MTGDNGNGQIHTTLAAPVAAKVLWCVYHEEERQALVAAGLDATEITLLRPEKRHVVLLQGSGDFYAIGRGPEDAAHAYRQGAASVKHVVVPINRNSNLARALESGVWTIDDLHDEAGNAQVVPYVPEPAFDNKGRINWSRLSDLDMGIRLVSSIKPKRIEWLMPDRIPNLAYTLIAGEGKQGKSQFTMALGALFSMGGEWWDGSGRAKRGHVLYLSAEDDAERAIRPRLEALGADLDMMSVLEARYKIPADDGKEPLISFTELGDLDYWREVFRRVTDPLVIFVDPIPSYIGRSVNDRKNSEVRAILGPFIALCVDFGITMIGVTHLGKSIDPTKPIANRVLDSIAYTNLARAVHFVAKDPEDHDRKFFLPGPCNYSPAGLEALAFKLVEKEIMTEDGEVIIVAVPEFETATVDVSAQDIVSVVGRKKPGPQSKVRTEIAEWLYDRLKDSLPVGAGLLHNEAAEAFADRRPNPMGTKQADGYWSNGRNLRRAADVDLPELGYPRNGKRVEKYQDPTQNNRWYWRLVDKAAEVGVTAQLPIEEPF